MAVISLKLRKFYLFTVSNNNAFPINFRRENRGSILSSSLFLFTSTSTLLLILSPEGVIINTMQTSTSYWQTRMTVFTGRNERKKQKRDDGEIRLLAVSVWNHSLTGLAMNNKQTAGTAQKLVGVLDNNRTLSVTPKVGSLGWQCTSEMRHCPTSVIYRSHAHTQWRGYTRVLEPARSRDQEGT